MSRVFFFQIEIFNSLQVENLGVVAKSEKL